ncbi:WD repeat protein [Aspergillus candidus]|uniref:RAVE protein 1 C terminal-domain-containing protein n=1 Tax=Aspergillus candidus TaxID=41067 RepID=A0A2I2F371_ASPCN|nr:RAVE protein 1 C terminal-domain-containing protein [Aspergillus candidus]PLB35074.1 RAVE protein 1 C terminal-domain-containing protein [Aspergillus candidus]
MRAVLPGRPPPKLQSFTTALWDGLRVVAYISGNALVILGGPHKLLQTIYIDDTDALEAVTIDESSGKIATCGGSDAFVYQPYGIKGETLKWSLAYTLRSDDDDETIRTLSWGSPQELLLGNSHLTLWFLNDDPRIVWKRDLASPVKFAQFSPDAALVVTTGQYDRLVKVWRRLSFGADDVRFEVSYLPHPAVVTGMHWRKPFHREQSMENVFYTWCADNKIRVWATVDHHTPSALQLWTLIDMGASVQPRHTDETSMTRRYGFVVDSRDFCVATEQAVQRRSGNHGNHTLEHIIEVAKRSPEICVVLDGQGHMSAWAMEDVGSKAKADLKTFNVLHVEGLDLAFMPGRSAEEDYAQMCAFHSTHADDSLSILVHHFDGRIEWFDSQVDVLFDPAPRKHRISMKASWTGHNGPVKKIVRNAIGDTLASRTSDNKALIWRQTRRHGVPVLLRQSTLYSDEHIHRSCVVESGDFLVNLHHNGISVWDICSFHAQKIAATTFQLSSKPLCVLPVPSTEKASEVVYIATIGSDLNGFVWEIRLPTATHEANGATPEPRCSLEKFCSFSLDIQEDISYILPVDPAGPATETSGFFDLFSPDIALSYTKSGTVHTWTAKVDRKKRRVDWLLTSTIETGITNLSLASGSSIKKAALVDEDRTHLTIWDTSGAQLEFEEQFSQHDIIRDLDWTSTPDRQSVLAVGFPHKVILLSQLRYDYLDARPSWTQIREIWIRDLTPHPIGDSCWLSGGHLAIGAGNQLFVYGNEIDATDRLITHLRFPSRGSSTVDLFEVVSRLNGPLPVFHPQFLAQYILSGKTGLVHSVLMNLLRKLKFYTEGDDIDGFLEMPLERFYLDRDSPPKASLKDLNSSFGDLSMEDEPSVVDENSAATLTEYLSRFALPQLSSQEQFRLVDTVECVATVEKHRRSMDDNAARYLLFFRQHMLRRTQGVANKDTVSWREIVWAFHSGSQDILVDLVSRQFGGKLLWKSARESGMLMWLSSPTAIRAQLEIIARNEYTKTDEKNPVDCSLFYLALRKKNILQGLWRMAHWNREQGATQRLLANDFQDPRWKTSALKNAYALLGRRRFEYAAAFFLLADHLRDAALVCLNQVGDVQLAIAITRAYEGDDGPVLKEILEERVIPEAASDGNRWMASWAFWLLGRRDMAVRSLISSIETLIPSTPASPASAGTIPLQAKSYLSNDPALVVLYRQIREKTLQTLKGASKVSAQAEWSFIIRNARLYDRMGCDLLALDLVRHWEFLSGPPTIPHPPTKPSPILHHDANGIDYSKMLRRRSSLVVADMPIKPSFPQGLESEAVDTEEAPQKPKPKPPPTTFHEPDANSLLDSFGF